MVKLGRTEQESLNNFLIKSKNKMKSFTRPHLLIPELFRNQAKICVTLRLCSALFQRVLIQSNIFSVLCGIKFSIWLCLFTSGTAAMLLVVFQCHCVCKHDGSRQQSIQIWLIKVLNLETIILKSVVFIINILKVLYLELKYCDIFNLWPLVQGQ